MIRRRAILATAAAAALAMHGCDRPTGPATALLERPGPGPRDVLLVTVDTLRHDATGFSGSGKVETPTADALAAHGRVFSFAHAHAVVTLPSHASILTGLYPYQHGIRDNAGYVLDPDTLTLATHLRAAGYRTAAFVSAFTLDRRYGLTPGFEVYDDEYDGYRGPGFTPPERPGSETVARAVDWWRRASGQRRFLWVHTFTPHFPYEPAQPFAERHRAQPYYGDAEMADAELAPLLEAVRADSPDAVVVYTADHGEALGEHGERTHGLMAYESTLRVPLVLRADGLVRPGVTDDPARHVDLLPTILHLVGRAAPSGLPGRSLFAALPAGHDGSSYFEALSAHLNRGWAPLYGRLEGRTKAIRLPIPELYDLVRDPGETHNLADARAGELGAILARLPADRSPAERAALAADEVERLRALGYLAGGGGGAADPDDLDEASDPKNLVHLDAALDAALATFRAGDPTAAIAALEELIEERPHMPLAYAHLSFFYSDVGRVEDAVRVLSRAVELGVANESIRRKLALALTRAARADEARAVLAVHADSNDPGTQSALGRIAATLGEHAEARERFERALRIDPTYPTALLDLGTLLLMQGRHADARPWLERAVADDPYLAEAWNALGALRSQTGDVAGAREAWERALEVDPRLTDALYNLALAQAAAGDRVAAAQTLERYMALVRGKELREAQALLRRLGRAPG